MDLTDSFVLRYGGFDEDDVDNIIDVKNEIKINDNIEEITKIIKYNDYKNHKIIKMNDCECPICLEEFKKEETTHLDIIKSIEEHKNKLYLNEYNLQYECELKETIINNTCIISCYHIFHKKCLLDWYKKNKSCPICRKNLNKIK
jgi:hypothetical protein